MKLDELQKLVDFMKENGVADLEYTEKNNSVRLRLAPPAPPMPPCPEGERAPSVTAEDVKNAASKAAATFSDSIKASAAAAAEFIKTKRDEYAAGEEPVDADVEEAQEDEASEEPTEAEEETVSAEEEPQTEADAEPEDDEPAEEPEDDGENDAEEDAEDEETEKVKLNTGAVRSAAKKAGEAVANTAKAGVSLGKLGLTRGKDALSALFPQKDEAEEAVSEEPAAEEAPADEEETKTEE